MLTLLGVLAVVALILATSWFVAGEFAYVAARRSRIEEMAGAGSARAGAAVEVLKRLSFMLSGAQLGITVTSIALGFIAEPTLARALAPLVRLIGVPAQAVNQVAFSAAFVLATTALMVFGELAPKNLAIAKPEAFAVALAPSTRWYLRLAGPLITLFDGASNRLVRAFGIEPVQELAGGASPEELELIISESERSGDLSAGQASLLSRSLDFRRLRAGDAMVPRTQVISLPLEATCDDLRRAAMDTGHSRFPVVAGDLDDVRGVVGAKDILRVPLHRRATTPLASLMAAPLAVPESALLALMLADLRAAHSQLSLVVDEHGGTAGIITLEDIVEELVGDIRDEYDPAEPVVHALADGSYAVPGAWRLHEVERDTGVHLPSGDYDTLSGLIMERLGRLPKVGDVVELEAARLGVDVLDGHAVGRVRLVPGVSPTTEADA